MPSPEETQSAVLKLLLRTAAGHPGGWCSLGDLRTSLNASPLLLRDILLRLETSGQVQRSASGSAWRLRD
jgi:DNA-binding IscR family transcriptional regulator